MKKILIIGNNANGKEIFDGGCIKIRLYYECLKNANYDVSIFDLHDWKKIFLFKFFLLIKNVKKNDVILIMGGPRGSRLLIPIINFFNVKKKKRIVYCPLGTGTIEKVTKKLSDSETQAFIKAENFFNLRDERMKKELSKLSAIIPQNRTLVDLYRQFYQLSNVYLLNNFRNIKMVKREYNVHFPFRAVFLSRISENKGIFMLIDAIKSIENISLDIFGQIQLDKKEEKHFFDEIANNDRINYCGLCDSKSCVSLLSKYDLFCLPTKYKGEGTPGSFIEAMIAGTPSLLSSYSQAKELIQDKKNGFIFEICDANDLKRVLKSILSYSNEDLQRISYECQQGAKKYLFSTNERYFYKIIVGE